MWVDLRLQQRNLHLSVFNIELTFLMFLALQALKISDDIIYRNGNYVLIMEMQSFPLQKLHEVVFPVLKIDITFHVIFQIPGQGSYNHKIGRYSNSMSRDLNINVVFKKKVAIKKDGNDQYAQCLKKVQRIPK